MAIVLLINSIRIKKKPGSEECLNSSYPGALKILISPSIKPVWRLFTAPRNERPFATIFQEENSGKSDSRSMSLNSVAGTSTYRTRSK